MKVAMIIIPYGLYVETSPFIDTPGAAFGGNKGAIPSMARRYRFRGSPQETGGMSGRHRLSVLLRSSCTLNPLDFACGYLSGSRTAMPSPIGLVTSASAGTTTTETEKS